MSAFTKTKLEGATASIFPSKIGPMLLHKAAEIVQRPGWLYEPKLDGMRALVFVRSGNCKIYSRNGRDITAVFPELIPHLREQPDCVLDAELIVVDEKGQPDFEALQGRWLLTNKHQIEAKTLNAPAVLYVFDMLYADGHKLTGCKLINRKCLLEEQLVRSAKVQFLPTFEDGAALLEAGRAHGLEGVISKRADSLYQEGVRSKDWIKTKYFESGNFVIVGHLQDEGYLVASPENPRQILGVVQFGFTMIERKQLQNILKECSIASTQAKNTVWFEPKTVVRLEYMKRTKAGYLRFPVFRGFA